MEQNCPYPVMPYNLSRRAHPLRYEFWTYGSSYLVGALYRQVGRLFALEDRRSRPRRRRISTRILRPSIHPNSCMPCRKALVRAFVSGSSADGFTSTPTRRRVIVSG